MRDQCLSARANFDTGMLHARWNLLLFSTTLTSDEELGLDNFIERDGNDASISVTEGSTRKEMKILLEQQPMVIHQAIIYRRTAPLERSEAGSQTVMAV